VTTRNDERDAASVARAFWEELHTGDWNQLFEYEQRPWIDAAHTLLVKGKIGKGHSLFVGVG
jgi:hypothetical protein